ncbi:MAG: sensor histidine kinase [Leptolyngbyaceae cyanobacterium]
MTRFAVTPRNHPFPSLLYLEWGLLLLAIAMELFGPLRDVLERSPLLPMMPLVLFGVMGLWLPTRHRWVQWLHVGGQMSLIMVGTFGFIGHIFPFPHLIMVFRSTLMFQLVGRGAVTAIAVLLFIITTIQRIQFIEQQFSSDSGNAVDTEAFIQRILIAFGITFSALLVLSLLMILLLMSTLLTERQSREQIAQANQQLRDYALRIETLAMEQERSRIAREIHDSLGHILTALNLQIEGAIKLANRRPEQAQIFLQDAKKLGSEALEAVRQSVATLRTNPLQGKTLAAAIATLTQDFQRATQIQPQLEVHLHQPPSLEISTSLYRIIQEALTNIIKHADATAVTIHLTSDETQLLLTITDDGKGFDRAASQHSGFGLQGIHERVTVLNGQWRINSMPGQGCQIVVQLSRSQPQADQGKN